MADIARVILTFDCDKSCSYCCNKYSNIIDKAIPLYGAEELRDFSTVLITGGEPMLRPIDVLSFIKTTKKVNLEATIYLYTAKFTLGIFDILPFVEGVHFTIHADTTMEDILEFRDIQEKLYNYKHDNPDISFRLYIHPDIKLVIDIIPYVWSRIESKPWLAEDECQLPYNETLFKVISNDKLSKTGDNPNDSM